MRTDLPISNFKILKMQKLLTSQNYNYIKQQQHPYHVLTSSKLPIMLASFAGLFAVSFIVKLHGSSLSFVSFANLFAALVSEIAEPFFFDLSNSGVTYNINLVMLTFLAGILCIVGSWSYNLVVESDAGHHTLYVQRGLKYGMIIFLISEAMLFFPFFWAFFHGALSPSVAIGGVWPPVGLEVLNPFMLPFVNTVVLLSSGVAVVAAHRAIISGYRRITINSLYLAISFGLFFSWLQFIEYGLTDYTINDGLFGSVFFMLTGLHGFHVIVGTVLLLIAYCRILNNNISREHHIGF